MRGTSTSPGIERLRLLYSVIAGIPANRIDLYEWRQSAVSSRHGRSKVAQAKHAHTCGTLGCAVGWATAHPDFNAMGFTYAKYPASVTGVAGWSPMITPGSPGRRNYGWDAVEQFFDLTSSEAETIFAAPEDDESREDHHGGILGDKRLVLARIREYLTRVGAITYVRALELAEYEENLD